MKALTLLICFLLITFSAYSQKPYAVTFGELQMKMSQSPRPIVVKVGTDWCGICKIQDKQLEKSTEAHKLLSLDYYFVELDAETRQDIFFGNKMYRFVQNGKSGIHELATTLCGANGAYPCWIVLSPEYEITETYNGLLKKGDLTQLLKKR